MEEKNKYLNTEFCNFTNTLEWRVTTTPWGGVDYKYRGRWHHYKDLYEIWVKGL